MKNYKFHKRKEFKIENAKIFEIFFVVCLLSNGSFRMNSHQSKLPVSIQSKLPSSLQIAIAQMCFDVNWIVRKNRKFHENL